MSKTSKIILITIFALFLLSTGAIMFIENKVESTLIQEMAKTGGKAEQVVCSIFENECQLSKFSADNDGNKITIESLKFNGLTSIAMLGYKVENNKEILGNYSFDVRFLNVKINNQGLNIKVDDKAFPELNEEGNIELAGGISFNAEQNATKIKISIDYIAEKLLAAQLEGHFVFNGKINDLKDPNSLSKLSISKVNLNLEQRNSFAKKILFVNYLRKVEGITPTEMSNYHKSIFGLEDVEKSLIMTSYIKHVVAAYGEKAPDVFKTRYPTVKIEHPSVIGFIKDDKSSLKIEVVNLSKKSIQEDVLHWMMQLNPNDFIVTIN